MAHRILGLAKINLRVLDLDGTIERFGDLLGAEPLRNRGSDTIGAFDGATMRLGDVVLDVVAPNDPAGELAKNIERRGEGLDSIALLVENLDDTAAHLARQDVELVNRTEYHGNRIGFIHPKQASGVLIELIERQSEDSN
jgi:methylmalonyl-CoA/ethylmalonyl-CoA epimerase